MCRVSHPRYTRCVEQPEILPGHVQRELAELLRTVHPGQRVRCNTLLALRISDPLVEAVLRNREWLSSVACDWFGHRVIAEAICAEGTVILRRRLSQDERSRAVVDLNNLVWTVEPARAVVVLETLRRYGVGHITGVGDANLPYLVSRLHLETLGTACDLVEIAPGGVSADGLILERARDVPSLVVSNDTFRDWRRTAKWCRRVLWRVRVPVARDPSMPEGFSFGDIGVELRSPLM